MTVQTPKPIPTAPPSTYGLTSYIPMSSSTNQMAANYQAPVSSNSGQLNAYGNSWYAGSPVATSSYQPSAPTTVKTTSGGGPTPDPYADLLKQGVNNLNSQAGTGMEFIDKDYEIAMGALGNQEQGLQREGDIASSTVNNEFASAQTSLGQEKDTKIEGANATLSTAEGQGAGAMQQARDLSRQTQQRNNAQLSALGISSSSVAEAMAETLGVETARRIAGVTGSLSEIRINTTKEIGNINGYYKEKVANLEQVKATEMARIQNSLITGLNAINTARQQAANDKASRRQELMTNAQNAIYNLNSQYQQFQQSLALWREEKTTSLSTAYKTAPEVLASITANLNTLQKAPGLSQYDLTAQADQNASGGYQESYGISPKKSTASNQPDWATYPNDGYTY